MSGLFERLTGLELLDPWLLLGVVLIPAVAWFRRRRGVPAVTFAPGAFLVTGADPDGGERRIAPRRTWRARLASLPRWLHGAGLVLVLVAAARPVLREALPTEKEGIDILLCLDVSSSMAERDLDPSRTRLDVARDAARRFVENRGEDRIGLVVFARYPDLVSPPTLDHAALSELLDGVELIEKEDPEDATGIGTALAFAARVLRESDGAKVVILLTDGEENVATARTPEEIAPLHAAQLCRDLGVRAYTIAVGVGTPDGRGGWLPIDTRQVRRAAARTGGRFFAARNAGALASVYAAIDELEKAEQEEQRFVVEERFLPFLSIALLLILAARALEVTWLEVLP